MMVQRRIKNLSNMPKALPAGTGVRAFYRTLALSIQLVLAASTDVDR